VGNFLGVAVEHLRLDARLAERAARSFFFFISFVFI
jgi:hypothetical protein